MVDLSYARLEAMRDAARAVSADVLEATPGGTHQARLERDVRVQVTERRLASLQLGEAGLVFGRTDSDDGERRYIGRLAVSDADNEPLVIDWRAPAAETFYRATPGAPMGLVRRRHLMLRGRELVGIDDELLTADATSCDLVLVGEGALLAALRRTRSGRMADIVATIQREQDEIVRAPLPGILLVQGGPGTGKTAVALHRAAYLLYTHRFPLERAGVLLVGPSRMFLRYIERVLPALGENSVSMATPIDLFPREVTGTDSPIAARVKGDARMAEVIAKAVADRGRPLAAPVHALWQGCPLTLTVGQSRRIVEQAKRRRGTHNERRPGVERAVLRQLTMPLGLADDEQPAVADVLHSERPIRAALERMWPLLTPEELLHDLLGWPALIRLAGRGLLDEAEVNCLYRPRSERPADVEWTENDLPLLDEASVHLGAAPRRRASRTGDPERDWERGRVVDELGELDPVMRRDLMRRLEADDGRVGADRDELQVFERTFGHAIVDEAQDLSPMQLRMIGRRVPGGSMTVLGDLGQATGARAPSSWDDVLAHLPASGRRDVHRAELTVNYRTPAEVMDVAAAVLAHAAPEITPSRSVRDAGVGPFFDPVGKDPAGGNGSLADAVLAAARTEREAVPDGKVAVIAAPSLYAGLVEALGGAGLASGKTGPSVLDEPLVVLTVRQAKGLEFDSVIVAEPAAVVAENQQGGRALYLAITRSTRRIRFVFSKPLPRGLTAEPLGPQSFPVQ